MLPELSPEDMRLGRKIQKDSWIEWPSVSHLARLSQLAKIGVIGEYRWLTLNTDYSSVPDLAHILTRARYVRMLPGTVLSTTQWDNIVNIINNNSVHCEGIWLYNMKNREVIVRGNKLLGWTITRGSYGDITLKKQ